MLVASVTQLSPLWGSRPGRAMNPKQGQSGSREHGSQVAGQRGLSRSELPRSACRG